MKITFPRWIHRLYAFFFGYFWLPCPLCGEMFGGHEGSGGDFLMTSWCDGKSVCPRCTDEAKRRNQKWMREHPTEAVYYVEDKPFRGTLEAAYRSQGGEWVYDISSSEKPIWAGTVPQSSLEFCEEICEDKQ